ncbi:MAG: hypothetical protein RI980_33 [Bacteroidota bacterium]|jgi:hypothetical protein
MRIKNILWFFYRYTDWADFNQKNKPHISDFE